MNGLNGNYKDWISKLNKGLDEEEIKESEISLKIEKIKSKLEKMKEENPSPVKKI